MIAIDGTWDVNCPDPNVECFILHHKMVEYKHKQLHKNIRWWATTCTSSCTKLLDGEIQLVQVVAQKR